MGDANNKVQQSSKAGCSGAHVWGEGLETLISFNLIFACLTTDNQRPKLFVRLALLFLLQPSQQAALLPRLHL